MPSSNRFIADSYSLIVELYDCQRLVTSNCIDLTCIFCPLTFLILLKQIQKSYTKDFIFENNTVRVKTLLCTKY